MRRKFWLLRRLDELRTSYWFVPGVMVLGAIVLAIVMQYADARIMHAAVPGISWLSKSGADGARSILATIAGSTITVTSVIFSITIVAISMASNQFGPRLIRNFMRSGGAQFALGLFLACFVYCLLILVRIPGDSHGSTPYLSVAVGLAFGIACFLALIYYIHHIATFVQAPQIIHNVTGELVSAMARIYPARADRDQPDAAQDTEPGTPDRTCAEEIACEGSGYVMTIGLDLLFDIALEYDATIDVKVRAGHFCVSGEPIMTVFSRDRTGSDCRTRCLQAVELGTQRSPTQDPEFVLNQLVEIGVRALSPGINDPFTAVNCIDRIGAALTFLASRRLPNTSLRDEDRVPRLRFVVDQHETLVHSAFDQLRQHANGNAAVMIRMLDVIDQIARAKPAKGFADCLKLEADLIYAAAESIPAKFDRDCLSQSYDAITQSLAHSEPA